MDIKIQGTEEIMQVALAQRRRVYAFLEMNKVIDSECDESLTQHRTYSFRIDPDKICCYCAATIRNICETSGATVDR